MGVEWGVVIGSGISGSVTISLFFCVWLLLNRPTRGKKKAVEQAQTKEEGLRRRPADTPSGGIAQNWKARYLAFLKWMRGCMLSHTFHSKHTLWCCLHSRRSHLEKTSPSSLWSFQARRKHFLFRWRSFPNIYLKLSLVFQHQQRDEKRSRQTWV